MGCFGSRVAFFRSCAFSGNTSRQNSRRQNTFAVQNVDDTGQGVSPGKLEVTETDLVLHVKGKPSLTWPLRCLRRYGFDNDLFSFESGRRCPTGAGIFAFRCHRAQSLFNLLQAKIQGNPGSLPTVPNTPMTPPNLGTPVNTGGNPTAASTPASSTFVYVNLSESNSSRLLASSANNPPFPTASDPPDVVQTPNAALSKEQGQSTGSTTGVLSGGLRGTQKGSLVGSKSASISENHPVYMNVESHCGALYAASSSSSASNYQNNISSIPPPTAPRRSTLTKVPQPGPSSSSSTSLSVTGHAPPECALYSNVFCNHTKGSSSSGSGGGSGFPAPTSTYGSSLHRCAGGGVAPIQQEPAEINYAELDLKTDRPSSSSSSNSPYSTRLSLLNKHHQLISSNSASASASASTNSGGDGTKFKLESRTASSSSKTTTTTTDYIPPRLTNSQQNNGDLGYATIDFDKTAALSMITRSKITLGFGENEGGSSSSKKSRHGSTGL